MSDTRRNLLAGARPFSRTWLASHFWILLGSILLAGSYNLFIIPHHVVPGGMVTSTLPRVLAPPNRLNENPPLRRDRMAMIESRSTVGSSAKCLAPSSPTSSAENAMKMTPLSRAWMR